MFDPDTLVSGALRLGRNDVVVLRFALKLARALDYVVAFSGYGYFFSALLYLPIAGLPTGGFTLFGALFFMTILLPCLLYRPGCFSPTGCCFEGGASLLEAPMLLNCNVTLGCRLSPFNEFYLLVIFYINY